MKRSLLFLLALCGGLTHAQTYLGIRALHRFPTQIQQNGSYSLQVYVVNEGTNPFAGKVDIKMVVVGGVPFNLVHEFDVALALGGPLLPGDSVLWTVNNYTFAAGYFNSGLNDILVWPEALNQTTLSKLAYRVNYIPAVNYNPGQRSHITQLAPTPPGRDKMSGNHSGDESVVSDEESIRIFPIPAISTIHVTAGDGAAWQQLEVLSLDGKVLLRAEPGTESINVSALPSGLYFVRAYAGEKVAVRTFLRQ